MPHFRLLALPVLLVATLGLSACGGGDLSAEEAQKRGTEITGKLASGKITPKEAVKQLRQLADEAGVPNEQKKQFEQLEKQLDSLPGQ